MKWRWFGMVLVLLLSSVFTAAAFAEMDAKPMYAPVPTLLPSQPPPSVGTTTPEQVPSETPQPGDWVSAGSVAFDADLLTVEERVSMIRQLARANMRTSLAEYTLIAGLDTTLHTPCYLGQSARFLQTQSLEDHEEVFTVTMTLVNILRGEDAQEIGDQMISQIYSNVNALDDNTEFLVCDFEIAVSDEESSQKPTQIQFSMPSFQVVSEKGTIVPPNMYLLAGVDNFLTLVPGGSGNLRVVTVVEKGTDPTLLYNNAVWFSLLKPEQ